MLSYVTRVEIKWFLIGLLVGLALGYLQGSGTNLLGFLPL